ncbi:hypothetical protein AB205_0012630 [Aquarana catesbeiana]|uniref:Uncharacterized protein n=1 Tax=Aquarana catesbeiana TaxID=8400 RepID=A0A2G9P296_AQUCT|nr:hypothetical protein AB205_0012630 [Aquarana catesbeiana]
MSGNFEDALLAIDTTESKRKALQSKLYALYTRSDFQTENV